MYRYNQDILLTAGTIVGESENEIRTIRPINQSNNDLRLAQAVRFAVASALNALPQKVVAFQVQS